MWITFSRVMGRGWGNGMHLNVYLLVEPLWMGLCPLGHFPFSWLLLAAQQIRAQAGLPATRPGCLVWQGWHCCVPLLNIIALTPWTSCAVPILTIRKKSFFVNIGQQKTCSCLGPLCCQLLRQSEWLQREGDASGRASDFTSGQIKNKAHRHIYLHNLKQQAQRLV